MGRSRRMGLLARVGWAVVYLTVPSAAAYARSQDPDTARGLVARLDPLLMVAVLVLVFVGLVALARARRRSPATPSPPSVAARADPSPAPAPNERGPAYTAHFDHEVRTPITAILGYTEMLSARDASPAERVDFLEGVRRNCQALSQLADETLALARTESGDFTPFTETVDLVELLIETCATSNDAWDRLIGTPDEAGQWSALVVDVEDQEVDGPLLVQRLLLDHTTVPIIAVGDPQSLPSACLDSMIVLAKPTRVLKLYDAVRPYLHSAA